MTPEKEKMIFEVYGAQRNRSTTGGWVYCYAPGWDKDKCGMLIKLWETRDRLDREEYWRIRDRYFINNLESFLSSLHPESLPFDEILRRVER